MTHYIAMAGLYGYLPQYCQSHESFENAVDDLVELCCYDTDEQDEKDIREALEFDGFANLEMGKHGNEYAEIQECNCSEPEIHNDY